MRAPKIAFKIAVGASVALALGGAFFFFRQQAPSPTSCHAALHYSYFSTPPIFDKGYAEAPVERPDASIKAILVPHHLLAARLIAEAFGKIATDRAVTVVLISPNHFSAGKGKIITTAAAWRTPYGRLESDCGAVQALKSAGAASIEEDPFVKEHGISGIVPFIKKSLPNARVVPVIVRDDASDVDLERFTRAAKKTFGPDTLFVASFDFSHDMTDTAAQFHDRKSLAVIDALVDADAKALDIDSVPGLRLSMRLLDGLGATKFSLLAHSNSSQLTGRADQPDVTSYLVGTFSAGEKTMDDDVTLLACGDLMLARDVETRIRHDGPTYPFEGVPRLFKGSDIVIANAEGVFADVGDQKPMSDDDLRFSFATSLLPVLRRVGFTHLGSANNHAFNFGQATLEASRGLMREAGIVPFGDPTNAGGIVSRTYVRGRYVTQIGYHQFSGHGPEDVLAAILAARKAGDFVVVYPHWGVEYAPKPTQLQVSLAHAFIDAGADVVIGAHPHVIQPIEVYKGRAIFYSLGNFIFDQPADGPTGQGLALGVADGAQGTTFYLMPIDIRRAQAALMPYAKRSTLLQKLGYPSGIFTLKHSP